MSLVPTIDLKRLAPRMFSRPRISPAGISTSTTSDETNDVATCRHELQAPSQAADLFEMASRLIRDQSFDNAFLSSAGTPDERLISIIHDSPQVRRVFLWGRNPYPFRIDRTSQHHPALERTYPEWWTEKLVWLPEDIEAVPRVVDLLITDHSPWTCRFVQPRCCVLLGDAASAPRDEDYRWTSGPGWLLGHRCRPRSRQAMNYRTAYSLNGGSENEDPFGWY